MRKPRHRKASGLVQASVLVEDEYSLSEMFGTSLLDLSGFVNIYVFIMSCLGDGAPVQVSDSFMFQIYLVHIHIKGNL